MLQLCHTDAQIATIIGHEVGHVVARHTVERITNQLWIFILQLILYSFFMPKIFNKMWSLLLRRFLSRRMEIEADYIGLILLASAGYDPRAAPKLYKKFQRITGDSTIFSTHPSGNKRAEFLAQTQVMEEALTIYKNARAGRGFNAQIPL
ncbi:unnamed protein product [Trifolium pratense]|uniref:Uncharacterized protein n=1 Tax=Trifolium pratense TaxID=57577 RepID=A0ACB0LH99_TRIPR|nr:unnamed protein product [Trifolium pratense]